MLNTKYVSFNKRLIHYVAKITIVASYNENFVSGSDIENIYSYLNNAENRMPKCQVILFV